MRRFGIPIAPRRLALLATITALLAVPVLVSQAGAALPLTNPPTFTFVNDENGADDQPGQKDLSAQAVAVPAPGDLWVSWKWDVTSLSGGNTGDGCALFDTDGDSRVNFAICVTIQGNPAVQATTSPRVYTCGDGKVDRCTSTYTQVSPINSACATNTNATDPFHSGQKDTQAICHIDLADVGGAGTANLVNTCSYPSQQPTSDPSDCVLIPRDAFLKITKIADPNEGSFPFRLGPNADPTIPVVFTASGSQSSAFMPIRSDIKYKLKEDVPTNWAIDTPAPSCTGASGSGSSNGAFSGDTITGIDASPDNQITCTFRDKKQTGAIRIIKEDKDTSARLGGAVFSIGSITGLTTSSANDATKGTVCQDGLAIGSHTVTETGAPNGYSKDSTNPRTVNVTSAGTCASGAAEVTFQNQVVPGTIVITKFGPDGETPLGGATFTLYKDVDPTGGSGPDAGDLATVTGKSCTTDATTGECTLTNVPLGRYWVVETGVPNGHVKAPDQNITIGVGSLPETGQTIELEFTNSAAPGTIVINKTGDGGPLEGATFELWTDANPLTTAFDPKPLGADEYTGKSCTSLANGTCTLLTVAPGEYWLVETVTPDGFETVDPVHVTVPLNTGGAGGSSVPVDIDDPVVPGSVTVQKTGVDGALDGAEFTLFLDEAPLGTFGSEDDQSAGSCTTGASDPGSGECTIDDVAPGSYWLVETITPDGYSTVEPQLVEVELGSAANEGDDVTVPVENEPVPGTVSITKKDDAGNLLAGAEFTLYVNNPPLAGPRGDQNPDPVTDPALTCETDGSGTCDITGVPLGNYWVVETKTPDHYDTAADEPITVGLGNAANTGATVPVTRVNPRQHRVVVLVCHEGTDTLHESDVTVGSETKQSLNGDGLTDAEEAALCNAGGASFGDIGGHPDDVAAHVDLSSPGHQP